MLVRIGDGRDTLCTSPCGLCPLLREFLLVNCALMNRCRPKAAGEHAPQGEPASRAAAVVAAAERDAALRRCALERRSREVAEQQLAATRKAAHDAAVGGRTDSGYWLSVRATELRAPRCG
jgi:hypothetical protein